MKRADEGSEPSESEKSDSGKKGKVAIPQVNVGDRVSVVVDSSFEWKQAEVTALADGAIQVFCETKHYGSLKHESETDKPPYWSSEPRTGQTSKRVPEGKLSDEFDSASGEDPARIRERENREAQEDKE